MFYFGDNGPNGARWNGGMKGTKGSADEGGVRVAGLMRWKGHIQAGTVIEEIAGAIDLLPTFADLVDIDLIVEKPLGWPQSQTPAIGRRCRMARPASSYHTGERN